MKKLSIPIHAWHQLCNIERLGVWIITEIQRQISRSPRPGRFPRFIRLLVFSRSALTYLLFLPIPVRFSFIAGLATFPMLAVLPLEPISIPVAYFSGLAVAVILEH